MCNKSIQQPIILTRSCLPCCATKCAEPQAGIEEDPWQNQCFQAVEECDIFRNVWSSLQWRVLKALALFFCSSGVVAHPHCDNFARHNRSLPKHGEVKQIPGRVQKVMLTKDRFWDERNFLLSWGEVCAPAWKPMLWRSTFVWICRRFQLRFCGNTLFQVRRSYDSEWTWQQSGVIEIGTKRIWKNVGPHCWDDCHQKTFIIIVLQLTACSLRCFHVNECRDVG